MTETELELLTDLHKNNARQGPGSEADTNCAIQLSGLVGRKKLSVADIGCGTGASALILAKELDAHITAVDFLQDFLDVLTKRAADAGLTDKITTLHASMEELPFEEESLDVIWSEGAIYNIGFERGVKEWKPFLKNGGVLVVSEITWLTDKRPKEIDDHWKAEYPEISCASKKIDILEKQGFSPKGYFTLPESSWMDTYYIPIRRSLKDFIKRNNGNRTARAIAEQELSEIKLYTTYKNYVSYGVYITEKV